MPKILQWSLQQDVNRKLPDAQAGFTKGRGTRANCQHQMDHRKSKKFQKNIYFDFIDYDKGFDGVDHNKSWEILKEMGIPEHLNYLLRILYAG